MAIAHFCAERLQPREVGMKTLSLVLALILAQILSAQTLNKSWIKGSLRLPAEFGVNFFIPYESNKPKFTYEELERKMAIEPQNPNWIYYYACLLSKDNKEAKPYFTKAETLFSLLEKTRPLRGQEIANWADNSSEIIYLDEAIKIAEDRLAQNPAEIKKVYYLLVDKYTQKAFFALMGIDKIPPATNLDLNIDLIVETYNRWRDEGIKPDLAKAQVFVEQAKKYTKLAEQDPTFGMNDYPDQDNAETQISFIEIFIKMITSAMANEHKTDKEIDEEAEKIFTDFLKQFSEPTTYRQIYIKEKAKTNPDIQAASIFFDMIANCKLSDLGSDKPYSAQTTTAINNAKQKYIAMTKSEKTKAYGYDGLVAIDMLLNRPTEVTLINALSALKLDPRPGNAFSFIIGEYLRTGQFEKVIEQARKKADKDHSDKAYLALLVAYILKNDYASAHKIIVEIANYQEDFKEYKDKINITIAALDILEGKYEIAINRLLESIRILPDNNIRAIALYDAACAALLQDDYTFGYRCLAQMTLFVDKKYEIHQDELTLLMMIPKSKIPKL